MKKRLRHDLHVKGWTKEEIKQAHGIIKKAGKRKHRKVKHLENVIYWSLLALGILGTVFLSLLLAPILIINNNAWSYIITGGLGFLLGALIIIIIRDMHWLEHHHHILISLLIPIIAILNFFMVVNRINMLNHALGIRTYHHPLLIGISYIGCFLIPYIYLMLSRRKA
jgi:hypothetical protein